MPMNPLNPFELTKADFLDHDEMRKRLQSFIADLLANDFEQLCALMYRHDVSESAFNQALSFSTDEERTAAIAELVIQREMQKMETRAAYAKQKNEGKLKA
jgi:hypothetical protein